MSGQAPIVHTHGFSPPVTRHMQRVYWGGRLKEGELHRDPESQISWVIRSDLGAQGTGALDHPKRFSLLISDI